MYVVIALLALIWISQRHKAIATGSAAAASGGWHQPHQNSILGGANLDGNMWDNGTTQPLLNSQWSGYDPGVGNIIFAVQGGEDGQNPARSELPVSSTQVTTLSRFQMLGGGDPNKPPTVPVQVNTINDVVRR